MSINNDRTTIEQLSKKVGIVWRDRKMAKMLKKVINVAAYDQEPVLIYGATGTGKELVAKAIHWASMRRECPFIPVNCTAIPRDLMESELFGHERGAFTGADCRRQGRFEKADGGILFLDEIGDMSPGLQAKMLRVLQEGEISRLGSSKTIKVDVRVICATHRNLLELIEFGKFREDLFYRLDALSVKIPALAKRKNDIPLLIDYFINEFKEKYQLPNGDIKISPEALAFLMDHDWRGNVRELQNVTKRAIVEIVSQDSCTIEEDDCTIRKNNLNCNGKLSQRLKPYEKEIVRAALEKTGWNRSRAAEDLSVSYKTLLTKITEHGLSP